MKKAAAAAARASTFKAATLHPVCRLLSTAFLAVLLSSTAQADGVDEATYRQIEHCIHTASSPVEACLEPIIGACGVRRTAAACDCNIIGEALDIAATDHPDLSNEIHALRLFIGQKCTAAASPDSWGALRIAEHALCVRTNRIRLIELLIADR